MAGPRQDADGRDPAAGRGDPGRRRRIVWTAVALGATAIAFYVAIIVVMSNKT